MRPRPDCCGHGIIERRRKTVFGRQTVIDGEHHVLRESGKVATECIALFDSALHVTTTMEIQHERTWFRAVWRVDARRDGRVQAGNCHVLDAAY